MSDFVPWSPSPANLDKHAVGLAVGAGGIGRLLKEAAHLLAYCTQPIAETILAKHTTSPASIVLGYTRNPGVDVLMIVGEMWPTTSAASFTTTVSPSAGSIAFMSTSAAGALSPFGGSTAAFVSPVGVYAQPTVQAEFLDVRGLTVGALTALTSTCTTVAGTSNGFRRLKLIEIPNGSTNVTASPTTEVGVAAPWASAGNSIDSSTLTSAGGFARLLRELERARTSNKRQWNLAWWETTAGAISRTNTAFGTFAYPSLTNSPNFKMRVRRLLETSVPSPHEGAWRYWVTGGGTAQLRLVVDGNVVQTWTGLTSATPSWTAFGNFDLPCTTMNQYSRWSLEGKSTAGTLYVSLCYGREKFV